MTCTPQPRIESCTMFELLQRLAGAWPTAEVEFTIPLPLYAPNWPRTSGWPPTWAAFAGSPRLAGSSPLAWQCLLSRLLSAAILALLLGDGEM